MKASAGLLFEDSDWDFSKLAHAYDAVEEIALGDLGLDVYPNQVEIISSEQMLDAYASFGMPLLYRHWSFGKRFAIQDQLYRKGLSNLAYEVVINANPCICYLMEQNTLAMQTLVIAHAAFGHNHFFKNNYAFRQWTDAEGILDYLDYARSYVASCEERYGERQVERVLDAAHALFDHGVFRFKRPAAPTQSEIDRRERARWEYEERHYNDLWRTVPQAAREPARRAAHEGKPDPRRPLGEQEENLIYFIECNSPSLEDWQREILRIVRTVAQYFYPQKQTRVMNEGCATFVHHYVANALFDRGLLSEAAMLEILHSHTDVTLQPPYDDPRYAGLNPYALGFAMMEDIRRICVRPTGEDREWFPAIAGTGDWRPVLRQAWRDYRDESFIMQFLSPRLIRAMRLFVVVDDSTDPHLVVRHIHDERGYAAVRAALAESYDVATTEPDIQVIGADLRGDRHLRLQHTVRNGIALQEGDRQKVLNLVRELWGYRVSLVGVDQDSRAVVYEAHAEAPSH